MTRIVHIITGLNTGGAETMLSRLVGGMDRSRFENRVISLQDGGTLQAQIEASGVPVTTLGMRRDISSFAKLVPLIQTVREQRPDILQTWLYHADFLGLLAGKIARIPRILWNVRNSDMDMEHYPATSARVLWALRHLSCLPTAVLVNSSRGQEWHRSLGYRPKRWVKIPNGIDVNVFRPSLTLHREARAELNLAPDHFVIGLIARYDPQKDHATFMAAARVLSDEFPDARFVLVGRGIESNNASLRAHITHHELQDRIVLCGERSDIPRLLASFDVLTLSSISEGFPNVLAEAMASGVPCVATDVGDVAEIVADTGVIVPPRDADALAAGWKKIAQMPRGDRRALGKASRARIVESYSLPSVITAYEKLYEELATKRGLTSPPA